MIASAITSIFVALVGLVAIAAGIFAFYNVNVFVGLVAIMSGVTILIIIGALNFRR